MLILIEFFVISNETITNETQAASLGTSKPETQSQMLKRMGYELQSMYD